MRISPGFPFFPQTDDRNPEQTHADPSRRSLVLAAGRAGQRAILVRVLCARFVGLQGVKRSPTFATESPQALKPTPVSGPFCFYP